MEKNPLSARAAPGGAPHRCSTWSSMGWSDALSVAFCVTRWATIR